MEWILLSIDTLEIILQKLMMSDMYNFKQVSKGYLELISSCMVNMKYHPDIFWGINASNIKFVCRDMRALSYTPIVVGKMNKSAFNEFINAFHPDHFSLSSKSVPPSLYSCILQNVPPCIKCLHILVGQSDVKNLRKLGSCSIDSICIETKDGITLDLATDLLHTCHCPSIKDMKLMGTVNNMSGLYYNLPSKLLRLYVETVVGVHETKSLKSFLELGLNDLVLLNCYEVCENSDCVNYHYISSRIRDARKLPKRLAMSPFPLLGMKIAQGRKCVINFEESNFFEHEIESIQKFFH
jgi:hypothetical protein